MRYVFDAALFRWAARRELWTFVRVPDEASAEIREVVGRMGGFASVRVDARIGATRFRTSIFGGADGAFVLPVKRAVRDAEGLVVDRLVRDVEIELVDH
ncbi:DUF1905 domain-containing protein [Agrococcus sp. SGAir0287]|uniref:DUF1905 domain-containing protein n=1 Tax=Agrococcus sp. SGAir0287 TaxID=2070347 RepID=UPI0010CD3609|nr:DUF1905 domain-containing protein [Agrococcus sp. SGAir0287]QCR19155.1 DUF1905 domain-containing protein [Agrococcus sp. SGAir0287]